MAGTKRGPRKKPSKLKIFEGNPGKRALPENEPEPAAGEPACPDWLNDTARAEWARVVGELTAMGVATPLDQSALAAYCQSFARWKQAELAIEATGITAVIRNDKGQVVKVFANPAVGVAKSANESMRRWAAEFGLTPATRADLRIPKKPAGGSLGAFVAGKHG